MKGVSEGWLVSDGGNGGPLSPIIPPKLGSADVTGSSIVPEFLLRNERGVGAGRLDSSDCTSHSRRPDDLGSSSVHDTGIT